MLKSRSNKSSTCAAGERFYLFYFLSPTKLKLKSSFPLFFLPASPKSKSFISSPPRAPAGFWLYVANFSKP